MSVYAAHLFSGEFELRTYREIRNDPVRSLVPLLFRPAVAGQNRLKLNNQSGSGVNREGSCDNNKAAPVSSEFLHSCCCPSNWAPSKELVCGLLRKKLGCPSSVQRSFHLSFTVSHLYHATALVILVTSHVSSSEEGNIQESTRNDKTKEGINLCAFVLGHFGAKETRWARHDSVEIH